MITIMVQEGWHQSEGKITGVKQCRSTGSLNIFRNCFFHQINFPMAGKERFLRNYYFPGISVRRRDPAEFFKNMSSDPLL